MFSSEWVFYFLSYTVLLEACLFTNIGYIDWTYLNYCVSVKWNKNYFSTEKQEELTNPALSLLAMSFYFWTKKEAQPDCHFI